MRHLATYLMLVIGGNASPSAEDVTTALAAVGVEVDADRLKSFIADMEGRDIEELIELGKEKLMKGGSGGGAVAGPATTGAVVETAAVEKPKEEEVDALEGGMDMFGGGDGGDY